MATTERTRTSYRTCPPGEAGCGLEITTRDGAVKRIGGDREDVFSRGFICPKGCTLERRRVDPDRLRRPFVRRDGRHVEVDWPKRRGRRSSVGWREGGHCTSSSASPAGRE
jgi:anaerobic selenocysteine-containing dehydrogenase